MKNKEILGVIGYPLKHSLSPALHNYLCKELGLNYVYRTFEIHPGALEKIFNLEILKKIRGFNVTSPFKEKIKHYIRDFSQESLTSGSVNTVLNSGDGLKGFDTDGIGFKKSILSRGIDIRDKRAVIIGAGGAARSVICALIQMGIKRITVMNRTPRRGEKVVKQLTMTTGFNNMNSSELSALNIKKELNEADLVINATPAGMYPDTKTSPIPGYDLSSITAGTELFHSHQIVYDLIYNPPETALMKMASYCGAKYIGGLDMFIFQALESFKLWTGVELDEEKRFTQLKKYLKRVMEI
ncbi:MAG: shikimate dehydrogenase [Fidelibacterota bacterium]